MAKVYLKCALKTVNVDRVISYTVTEYTSLFLDFFHQFAFPYVHIYIKWSLSPHACIVFLYHCVLLKLAANY